MAGHRKAAVPPSSGRSATQARVGAHPATGTPDRSGPAVYRPHHPGPARLRPRRLANRPVGRVDRRTPQRSRQRRRVCFVAHFAQPRQMNVPGVRASSATYPRGYTPPQQAHRRRPGTLSNGAGHAITALSVRSAAAHRRVQRRLAAVRDRGRPTARSLSASTGAPMTQSG
jgi:hypothetical protein